MIDVRYEGSEIVIRVRVDEPAAIDAIVPFTCAALEALGLEYAPALRAAKAGELRSAWSGRRRLTTRAWLLAYVQSLPAAVAPDDDIGRAARRRARRTRSGE